MTRKKETNRQKKNKKNKKKKTTKKEQNQKAINPLNYIYFVCKFLKYYFRYNIAKYVSKLSLIVLKQLLFKIYK